MLAMEKSVASASTITATSMILSLSVLCIGIISMIPVAVQGEIVPSTSSNLLQKIAPSTATTLTNNNNKLTIKGGANAINLIDNLRNQIKAKEQELQQAEVINKNFERMIQLVNILGQVDSFITDRTKAVIKKLAVLAEDSSREHDEDRS